MADASIKTADLCERCKHGTCDIKCKDTACSLYSAFGCRCDFVQKTRRVRISRRMIVMGDARVFFNKIRTLDRQIDSDFEQLERLKALSTKITAPMSDSGGKPSGTSRAMENAVEKIIELQKKLKAEIDELVDMKQLAHEILTKMETKRYRLCLEERYINGKTVEKTADRLGCTTRWAQKTINLALKEAKKTMEKFD